MNRNEWEEFLGGSWVKTAPTAPGCYPVADRNGEPSGTLYVVEVGNELVVPKAGTLHAPNAAWKGFWWSVSMPSLSECPKWNSQ